MSNQYKTMEQMKDSRLLFDKKPPLFGYILVGVVIFAIAVVVIWSIHSPKAYMITAQGTVTSASSNYVMSAYTGQIIDCNISEGKLVEEGDMLFKVISAEYNLQEEQLKATRSAYVEQAEKYTLLVQSIKEDINHFDETCEQDELYYSTFENYKAQIAQNEFNASTYKSYGYTDAQIQIEMKKNEGKLSEIYYTAIQTAEKSLQDVNLQIDSIDAQLSAIASGQNSYEVKATATGIIHLMASYKNGMVVQAASAVATITPEQSDPLIEAYVSTADMARMNEGDTVQISVDGLNQSVYGTISGTVSQIDSNSTSSEGSNGSTATVFKVKIIPDYDYLVDKKGNSVSLSNGMTVEARIEYDKVTYFKYLCEKLGFLTR